MTDEPSCVVVFQGSAIEARLVQGRLESEGISTCLSDENMGVLLPLQGMPTGFGSVKVLVSREDEEKALNALSQ